MNLTVIAPIRIWRSTRQKDASSSQHMPDTLARHTQGLIRRPFDVAVLVVDNRLAGLRPLRALDPMPAHRPAARPLYFARLAPAGLPAGWRLGTAHLDHLDAGRMQSAFDGRLSPPAPQPEPVLPFIHQRLAPEELAGYDRLRPRRLDRLAHAVVRASPDPQDLVVAEHVALIFQFQRTACFVRASA